MYNDCQWAWGLGDGLQGERLRIWSGGPKCDSLHIPSLPQLTVSQVSELSGLATFISLGAGWRLVQKREPSHPSSEAWGQGWTLSCLPCPGPALGTALRRGLQMRPLSDVEVALSCHNPTRYWGRPGRMVCVCVCVSQCRPGSPPGLVYSQKPLLPAAVRPVVGWL